MAGKGASRPKTQKNKGGNAQKATNSLRLTSKGKKQKEIPQPSLDSVEEEPSAMRKCLGNVIVVARFMYQTILVVVAVISKAYSMLVARKVDKKFVADDVNPSRELAVEKDEETKLPFTPLSACGDEDLKLMRFDSTCSGTSEVSLEDISLRRTMSLPLIEDPTAEEAQDIVMQRSRSYTGDESMREKKVDVIEVNFFQTFTDGVRTLKPVIGPNGEQRYTDGEQLYMITCAYIGPAHKSSASEAASETTHISTEGTGAESDDGSI